MISVTALRTRLLPVFRMLGDTGIDLDVNYKGNLYKMTITPTGEKVKKHYAPRPGHRKKKINPYKLEYKDCRVCGDIVVAGVCLKPNCPSNKKLS